MFSKRRIHTDLTQALAGHGGAQRPVRDTATSEPREIDSCHPCLPGREKLLYKGGVSITDVSHVMWAWRQMCHAVEYVPRETIHQPDVCKKVWMLMSIAWDD